MADGHQLHEEVDALVEAKGWASRADGLVAKIEAELKRATPRDGKVRLRPKVPGFILGMNVKQPTGREVYVYWEDPAGNDDDIRMKFDVDDDDWKKDLVLAMRKKFQAAEDAYNKRWPSKS